MAESEDKTKMNEASWNRQKPFSVEKDAAERVTRIEGWLSLREMERTAEDKKLQNETGKLERSKSEKRRNVMHLIAISLGGPDAASEHAKDNLVMGDERINKSYLSTPESIVREKLKKGVDIYCQVDVQYKDGQAKWLVHRFLLSGSGRKPEMLMEVTTNIDILLLPYKTQAQDKTQVPNKTLANAMKSIDKENLARDFYSVDRSKAANQHDH